MHYYSWVVELKCWLNHSAYLLLRLQWELCTEVTRRKLKSGSLRFFFLHPFGIDITKDKCNNDVNLMLVLLLRYCLETTHPFFHLFPSPTPSSTFLCKIWYHLIFLIHSVETSLMKVSLDKIFIFTVNVLDGAKFPANFRHEISFQMWHFWWFFKILCYCSNTTTFFSLRPSL